jgi:hypothetical protein
MKQETGEAFARSKPHRGLMVERASEREEAGSALECESFAEPKPNEHVKVEAA